MRWQGGLSQDEILKLNDKTPKTESSLSDQTGNPVSLVGDSFKEFQKGKYRDLIDFQSI